MLSPHAARPARGLRTALAALLVAVAMPLLAADEEDEELFPGLTAGYTAGGRTIERFDAAIAFDWGAAAPDPRLETGKFLAEWTGILLVKTPTKYRFHAWLQGELTVEVAGKEVLASRQRNPGWISGEPIELPAGESELRVSYRRSGNAAVVKLFWSSDAFALEPIPEHQLFHEDDEIALRLTDRGRRFFESFRCNRCHRMKDEVLAPRGPSLARIGHLSAGQIIERIEKPAVEHNHPRMPRFGFDRDQTTSIAASLLSTAEKPKLDTYMAPKAADLEKQTQAGGTLFRSLGCLVCHTKEGNPTAAFKESKTAGVSNTIPGGDLTGVARFRSADWINTWLKDPARLNAEHRMPVYRLSDAERQQLVAYLTAAPPKAEFADVAADELKKPERIAAGRELMKSARCANCHQIPGLDESIDGIPTLETNPNGWLNACLSDAIKANRPSYETDFRIAIATWLTERTKISSPPSELALGQILLERNQCLGCHERGTIRGLAAHAGEIAAADPALKGQSEGLIPPALSAMGDKLQDAALADAVSGGFEKPRLPWLRVRMPKFQHTDAERAALVRYFVAKDRIPDNAPPHAAAQPAAPGEAANGPITTERLLAGQQLVGPRGFSCIACHEVGPYKPKNVALGTRGSDLLALGKRMRKDYYVRWTRSPARIVPGMEMPSYIKAAPTLFDEKIDAQLLATWDALNDSRFTPPTNPVAVEQFLVVGAGEPARIVRDVFTCSPACGTKTVPRAMAIGLNNGHAVLLDLETLTLRQWSFGDFARQRAEGKSWYWDLAGSPLIPGCSTASDLFLQSASDPKAAVVVPEPIGQTRRLIGYRNVDQGVALQYEVRFRPDERAEPAVVRITETFAPIDAGDERTAFRRTLRAENVPAGYVLGLAAHHSFKAFGNATIAIEGSQKADWTLRPIAEDKLPDGVERRSTLAVPANGSQEVVLRYEATLKPDRTPLPVKPVVAPVAENITTVPGYDGVRLPLDRSIMPTAIGWTSSEQLVFTSLKGHVFATRDTDGDGIDDALRTIEEGLAAPYGIIADGDDLLVAQKPELLRLKGAGVLKEGRVQAREHFAGGWGYSDNYHDWTCGIVRDVKGNFFIGLGSDYSDNARTKPHALWRGKVLRVSPKGDVTPIASAFRYPTGFAFDAKERLFVTDNQGVQNTFNELNLIVDGRSYGVPSKFEEQPDAPAMPPAVQIPHPWTRSVNGIAFLPAANRDAAKNPFAGHLIGCDYDTRMLIRMTIDEVNGTIQGAAYPFSLPEQGAGGKNFTGPLSIGVARNGDVYIGSIHDSGWLGGLNTGDIVRLRANGNLPNGIREVRAKADGFEVVFVHPVDRTRAADPKNYAVSGYTRVWKGAYATPDSGLHSGGIESVAVAEDGRSVQLTIDTLREGSVYDLSVRNLGDERFFPSEAHYTLHKKP